MMDSFCRDLAYQLRRKLGDWFRVVQILQSGAIASDAMQNEAWNELGDFYFDRQQWYVFLIELIFIEFCRFCQGRLQQNITNKVEIILKPFSVILTSKIMLH